MFILRDTYPELYPFLYRTCAALFCEELPDFGQQLATLDNISAFQRLYDEVQGDCSKITDTEAARAIYGSYEALLLVMRLRDLYHRKYYKGKVVQKSKVTFVQFKSSLTIAEENFLKENLSCLKELLASS